MKLSSLETSNEKFVIAGFDGVMAMADQFGLKLDEAQDIDSLKYFKTLLISLLSQEASGVVIDPIYGLDSIQHKAEKTGLLIRLEDFVSSQAKHDNIPSLIKGWGVEQTRNNYAVAKFELFYHPQEEKALQKKQLISELNDFCQFEGIDFLLILRIINPQGGVLPEQEHARAQLEAVFEFRSSCDLLAVEYPGDTLSCATLTAELDSPWLLAAHREVAGESYSKLKKRLREAMSSGARGIYIDQILWSDLADFRNSDSTFNWEGIKQFLQTSAKDKLAELRRIVEEVA